MQSYGGVGFERYQLPVLGYWLLDSIFTCCFDEVIKHNLKYA